MSPVMPSIPPAIPPTQLGFIPDWGGIGRCCKFYYDEYVLYFEYTLFLSFFCDECISLMSACLMKAFL